MSLIDLKKERVLNNLDGSFEPIQLWLDDTTFVYCKKTETQVNFGYYHVKSNKLEQANSVKLGEIDEVLNADFLATPNYIPQDSTPFFVYVNSQNVYKYYPFSSRKEQILKLSTIKGIADNIKINNIAINGRGTKLLLAARRNKIGYIYTIDLKNDKVTVIDKGREFSTDGSYAYYTKYGDRFVYYKFIPGEDKKVQVILYDLSAESSKVLTTYHGLLPTSCVDIPFAKALFINYLGMREPVKVTASKEILGDILKQIMGKFTVGIVSYDSNSNTH